jgi:hypothetical protein
VFGGCLAMKCGVFDTKKHTNVKRKAAYRRIGKYYKGLEKYQSERARRKAVLALQDQGLNIKQIAQELGVSERTVKRDLAKIMFAIKKKSSQLNLEHTVAVMRQLNSMSLNKRLLFIRKFFEQQRNLQRHINKTRKCSALLVTIDVDAALAGEYAVGYKPRLPVDMLENGKITLELRVLGRVQAIGRIYVGKATLGAVNLQTNQSMNTHCQANSKRTAGCRGHNQQ